MLRPLRILLLINAIATLAAGVVLFVFPGASPSTVGIVLAPDQAFVAWLLSASEFGIAALCIGALLGSASRSKGTRDTAQTDSSHSPEILRLAAITLIVFHAASAVADTMQLMQQIALAVGLNLALRIVMVVLLAVFGLRR